MEIFVRVLRGDEIEIGSDSLLSKSMLASEFSASWSGKTKLEMAGDVENLPID